MSQEKQSLPTALVTFGIAVALAFAFRLPAGAAARLEAAATCSGAITQIQASAVKVGMNVATANEGNMTVYDVKGTLKCKGTTTASADVQVDLRARYKITYESGKPSFHPSEKEDFFSKKVVVIGTTQTAVTGDGDYFFSKVVADLAKLEQVAKAAAPEGEPFRVVKSVRPFLDPNGDYNIRLINAKCAGTDLDVPATITLSLKGGKGNTAPK